jgi:AcrR family transcriptional regulator
VARVVKEEEHAGKRNEILAAAQRLVFTKGYEQMSIQDIVDALQISKGAFYHYFGSKSALLDGLIETIGAEAQEMLTPIVADSKLPAIEKLQRYFEMSGRWKTAHRELVLGLVQIWYADDNAIVRQKQQALAVRHIAPMVATIIRQGVVEGVFATRYPEQTAQVVLSLVLSLGDAWVDVLLSAEPHPNVKQEVEILMATYTEALERVLGAPAGSLLLMDAETIQKWLPESQEDAGEMAQLSYENGHT